MKEKTIKRKDRITQQLSLIDTINEMIQLAKEGNDKLGIKQYEHLKKQYIKNLFEMLAENYQIPMPIFEKEAA